MRQLHLIGAALSFLLTACADPTAHPATTDPTGAQLAGAPAHAGRSGVFRIDGDLAFFVVDPAAGLMSFHGIETPWTDLCSGTPPVFDPVDLQFILTPAGAAEAVFRADGHSVFVYPEADIGETAGPEDCAVMTGLPLLARGVASFVRTDNDIFGSGGPRVNAFGWEAHGVLEDLQGGGAVGYQETARYAVDQTAAPPAIVPQVVRIALR